jgi:hypothetical protein
MGSLPEQRGVNGIVARYANSLDSLVPEKVERDGEDKHFRVDNARDESIYFLKAAFEGVLPLDWLNRTLEGVRYAFLSVAGTGDNKGSAEKHSSRQVLRRFQLAAQSE